MTTPGETLTEGTRLTSLETQMQAVQDGQRQILGRLDTMQQEATARFDAMQRDANARFDAMNARFDALQRETTARFDAINARFDRLFYTILGLGIASLGTIIALERIF